MESKHEDIKNQVVIIIADTAVFVKFINAIDSSSKIIKSKFENVAIVKTQTFHYHFRNFFDDDQSALKKRIIEWTKAPVICLQNKEEVSTTLITKASIHYFDINTSKFNVKNVLENLAGIQKSTSDLPSIEALSHFRFNLGESFHLETKSAASGFLTKLKDELIKREWNTIARGYTGKKPSDTIVKLRAALDTWTIKEDPDTYLNAINDIMQNIKVRSSLRPRPPKLQGLYDQVKKDLEPFLKKSTTIIQHN